MCERNDFHLITEVLLPPKPTWLTEAKTDTERTVWIQNGCRPLLCEVRSPHRFVFRVARWGHFWAFLLLKTSKPEVYWRRPWSWTRDPVNQTVKEFSIQHIFCQLFSVELPFGRFGARLQTLFCFHCYVLYVPAEIWYLVVPQLYRCVLDQQQCSGRAMSTWHQHEWHRSSLINEDMSRLYFQCVQ